MFLGETDSNTSLNDPGVIFRNARDTAESDALVTGFAIVCMGVRVFILTTMQERRPSVSIFRTRWTHVLSIFRQHCAILFILCEFCIRFPFGCVNRIGALLKFELMSPWVPPSPPRAHAFLVAH